MGKPTEIEQITAMITQMNQMREKQQSLLSADISNRTLSDAERFTLRQERMEYDREMINFLETCLQQLKKMESQTAALQVSLFEYLKAVVKDKLESAKAKM